MGSVSSRSEFPDLPPPLPLQENQYEGENDRVIRLVQETLPEAANLSEGELLKYSEGSYGRGLYFTKPDTSLVSNKPLKGLTIDAFVAVGRSLIRTKECKGMDYCALVESHKCASVKGMHSGAKTEYVVYHKDQVYIREVRLAGTVFWNSGKT